MKRWYNRNALVVLGLIAVLILGSLVSGCSKKPEVETDPNAAGSGTVTETVPPPPVVEPTEPVVTAPDYAAMDPAEYGIGDVYFGFDEYELSTEAMGVLSRNARILREAGVTVLVSGHCDERGTVEYNLALGERRAKAAFDYLTSLGVPVDRMKTVSYGKEVPLCTESNEDCWQRNRRGHFTVTGK